MQCCEQGALHFKEEKEGWEDNDMRLLIEHAAQKAQILAQAQAISCLNEKRRCQAYTFIMLLIAETQMRWCQFWRPYFIQRLGCIL